MEHTVNNEAKQTMSEENKIAMKVSGISILVNLILSVLKLIAGIVAHSGAMISDAVHSASDVGSTLIVIVGVKLSGKNRTRSTSMDMREWNAYHLLFSPACCLLPALESV